MFAVRVDSNVVLANFGTAEGFISPVCQSKASLTIPPGYRTQPGESCEVTALNW
jgi:hypothetical protein